ncbi:MAG: hypothetical protein ACRD1X_03205 [Vicinamibacteria bacterium]
MARDEFPERVKRALAARAGYLCSRPECRASTIGPGDGPTGIINVGEAAHITAASSDGPRYDPSLTPEQRRSIDNGIWLCSSCADMVDHSPRGFSTSHLRAWRHQAEEEGLRRLGQAAAGENLPAQRFSDGELTLLATAAATTTGEIILLNTQQTGDFIRVGAEDFYDPDDAAFGAAYVEALESLLGRRPTRLVRHEGGQLYKLTGSGFKLGRALLGRWPRDSLA